MLIVFMRVCVFVRVFYYPLTRVIGRSPLNLFTRVKGPSCDWSCSKTFFFEFLVKKMCGEKHDSWFDMIEQITALIISLWFYLKHFLRKFWISKFLENILKYSKLTQSRSNKLTCRSDMVSGVVSGVVSKWLLTSVE